MKFCKRPFKQKIFLSESELNYLLVIFLIQEVTIILGLRKQDLHVDFS